MKNLRTLIGPLALLAFFSAALLQYGAFANLAAKQGHVPPPILYSLIQAGLWLASAVLVNRLLRIFVWDGLVARSLGTSPPRLLVDVGSLLIYVAAVVGVAAFVFHQPLTGLWATSGLVGLVLGLALRNVILDVFIGLAINFDRPYRIGDWIMIHGRRPHPEDNVIGCVTEINWRTTRLRTTDNTLVVVPNSVIGAKIVTNFMEPSKPSRFELLFTLEFSVPPEKALRILNAAVSTAAGILEKPHPKARINGINEMGVEYMLRYWILPTATSPNKARHFVCLSVLQHLRQAGLTLAYPKHDVYHAEMPSRQLDAADHEDRKRLLAQVPLFEDLRPEELDTLAASVQQRFVRAGEVLIERGAVGDSMFVLIEGLMLVRIAFGEDESEVVNRLSAGAFFGEASLLTGEPRSARIQADTDAMVYEITRPDIEVLMQRRPQVAEELSRALAAHQVRDSEARTLYDAEDEDAEIRSASNRIIAKMKQLFTWGE